MNILFLSRWYPYPPNNGSKIRIYNLLIGLGAQHSITLLSFLDDHRINPDHSGLRMVCDDIYTVPWNQYRPQSLPALRGFFSPIPRSFIDTFSPALEKELINILTSKEIDFVIASQVDMAAYRRYFSQYPAIFDEAEVGTLSEKSSRSNSVWHRFRYGLTWTKYKKYLSSLLKEYPVTTVVSEQEKNILQDNLDGSHRIEVIPNFVDLENYLNVKDLPQPNTLIYTGAFTYSPNYQAVLWFLEEVLPILKNMVPEVHLTVTGKQGEYSLPDSEHVTLTGYVNDIRPYIRRSWGSIAPIFTGGGTRLKILEAMALGTPVVATSKAAEGLDVKHGEHILIANSPETFANAINDLFTKPSLREDIAKKALQLVQKEYNSERILPKFLSLVDQISDSGPLRTEY